MDRVRTLRGESANTSTINYMKIEISEKIKETPITNPEEIAKLLLNILMAEPKSERMKEHFWGVYLNSKNNIIKIELISLGTLNANLVHPRETYAPAIESKAGSLIVSHNHPSGDVEPSEDDLSITKRLTEAGKILGIELQDHIIIAEKGKFYSFKKEKLL